mgnify:CR=1 FL=1
MSDEPEVSTDLAALMLAEERVALWLLTGAPAKPGAITIAEITAGENVSNRVFADGTYIRATNSDAINRPLLSGGNSSGVGASSMKGSWTLPATWTSMVTPSRMRIYFGMRRALRALRSGSRSGLVRSGMQRRQRVTRSAFSR